MADLGTAVGEQVGENNKVTEQLVMSAVDAPNLAEVLANVQTTVSEVQVVTTYPEEGLKPSPPPPLPPSPPLPSPPRPPVPVLVCELDHGGPKCDPCPSGQHSPGGPNAVCSACSTGYDWNADSRSCDSRWPGPASFHVLLLWKNAPSGITIAFAKQCTHLRQ